MFQPDKSRTEDNLEELAFAEEQVNEVLAAFKGKFPNLKRIYFGIFEYTSSENGIFNLWIDLEKELFTLCKTTYGRKSTLKEFSSLREALAYIQKHHHL